MFIGLTLAFACGAGGSKLNASLPAGGLAYLVCSGGLAILCDSGATAAALAEGDDAASRPMACVTAKARGCVTSNRISRPMAIVTTPLESAMAPAMNWLQPRSI